MGSSRLDAPLLRPHVPGLRGRSSGAERLRCPARHRRSVVQRRAWHPSRRPPRGRPAGRRRDDGGRLDSDRDVNGVPGHEVGPPLLGDARMSAGRRFRRRRRREDPHSPTARIGPGFVDPGAGSEEGRGRDPRRLLRKPLDRRRGHAARAARSDVRHRRLDGASLSRGLDRGRAGAFGPDRHRRRQRRRRLLHQELGGSALAARTARALRDARARRAADGRRLGSPGARTRAERRHPREGRLGTHGLLGRGGRDARGVRKAGAGIRRTAGTVLERSGLQRLRRGRLRRRLGLHPRRNWRATV